jgi:hypothetical protein
MDATTNFWLIWLIYLGASVIFYALFWKYINLLTQKFIVFILRGLVAALIFTPWFVNIQGSIMAPALMVVMLDLITIGPGEIARAGVPLFLSILTMEIVSMGLYFTKKKSGR